METTFLDLLDNKQAENILVADYFRYSHPTKDLHDMEPIDFHRWQRIIIGPVVLHKHLASLIDTIRVRDITVNRNLSGLVLDEIIKSDLQLVELIHLAGLKFSELPQFLALKHAIVNEQKTDNRSFGDAVLCALPPRPKNHIRPIWYDRFITKEGLEQICYAVTNEEIPAIEDKLKVCINLFPSWDDEGSMHAGLNLNQTLPQHNGLSRMGDAWRQQRRMQCTLRMDQELLHVHGGRQDS